MKTTHPGNLQCFLDVYKENLLKQIRENPQDYAWDVSQFDEVFSRMAKAIERGSFNKDSKAFKATCKELKIKHTYTAIREFISL
jgi:hypothetical protein